MQIPKPHCHPGLLLIFHMKETHNIFKLGKTRKSDQHTSRTDSITVNAYPEHATNLRGYVHIHNMPQRQNNTIIYVRMTYIDEKSYPSRSLDTVLEIQEREHNTKYILTCLNPQKQFTPFVFSVDILL